MSNRRNFNLPFLVIRGICVFPGTTFNLDIIRRKSYEGMEKAVEEDGLAFVVSQIDSGVDEIRLDNINPVGIIARVKRVARIPGNMARINLEGLYRGRVNEIEQTSPCITGSVIRMDSLPIMDSLKEQAISKLIDEAAISYANARERMVADNVWGDEAVELKIDRLASAVDLPMEYKLRLLEELDVEKRGMDLCRYINNAVAVLDYKNELNAKVKASIDAEQRKYFLREQLKVINNELGDEGVNNEVGEYRQRMEEKNLPDYAVEKLNKELDRLKRMMPGAQEGSVIRDYVETVLSLPWGEYSPENDSLALAEEILNRDHYGMEKVKERMVEFLAVKLSGSEAGGSILCLAGPPGVGKTSVAKSVAEALNRRYVRLSLGGMHDEAEIRGHRRTYLGAMPGRILSAIKQAGTDNPLILLDEVDKLGSDYKGDPSSALLEVLDGEQNYAFRDNYLDMPYDLSKVLFICTANNLDTIPAPLRDRLEIIELSSYTLEEKLEIAKRYLYPKQLKRHGLTKKELKLSDTAMTDLIEGYTAEAGVRQAERLIEKLCRIAVKDKLTEGKGISVTIRNIGDYLGKRIYRPDERAKAPEVGVCRGLAWTSIGGTTLEIEVNTYPGKANVKITGNVGKVMEESSVAALSYIRANAEKLGITTDFENTDIHIHIPAGATPKDGPSAGITMATAIISAMTGVPVRCDVAMTGEINIRGRVMPIGGLREKVLAAKRIGIKQVIIPMDNAADLEEIPDYAKEGIDFVKAEDISTVLDTALVKEAVK